MIESVMAILLSPFYNRHGSEVLFLPRLVRKAGITPRHIQRAMPHQWLETLDPHTRIEKLTGKGVPKGMKGIPLMSETGFRETPFKDKAGRTISHAVPALGVKNKRITNISHREPYLQSAHRIIAKINNPPQPVLLSFVNINPAIPEVKIRHLGVEQLTDSHPCTEKHRDHGPVSRVVDNGE
jgi:hypothetical protein